MEPAPHRPLISRRRVIQGGAALGVSAAIAPIGRVAAAGTTDPPGTSAPTTAPATIIHNATVFIGTDDDAIAEAIAIGTDGTIIATGTSADLLATAGPDTVAVDAGGATVMAGIIDGHVHPLGAAQSSLNPSLGNADLTVADLQAQLTELLDASADQEPDGWLVVNDWSPVGLLPPGTVAHRSMLDELDTQRPIFLQGSDYHNCWVNSRALELAGITADTPDVDGGEIVRDADGSPTGLLKDNAQDLVRAVIPPPTEQQVAEASAAAMQQMLANGITTFMDAVTDEATMEAYAALAAADALPQRVIPAITVGAELAATPDDAVAYAEDLKARYGDVPNLLFGTIKVFLDGVIEYPAQTAALVDPYLDADGNPTDNHGDLYVDGETMSALVTAFDAAGWQVHSHAIGDLAVRTALDAHEAARAANGDNDRRHTIAHVQLVHPDDVARVAETATVACMQLQWATQNAFTLDALRPYIGEDRFAALYPAKSIADAGGTLSGGSDWPVDPLSSLNQIDTAITRVGAATATGEPLGADQALSRFDSLRMHTAHSAFQLHLDDSGTLEAGKRADVVLLDRDITAGPDDAIKDATVVHTYIAGQLVYDAAAPVATPSSSLPAATGWRNVAGVHRHAHCCHPK